MKETNAQSSDFYINYKKEFINIRGMEYMFVYVKSNTSQTGYSTSIVNLTKDALEVKLLEKELRK